MFEEVVDEDDDTPGEWVRVVKEYADFDETVILGLGEKYLLTHLGSQEVERGAGKFKMNITTIWMGGKQVEFSSSHFERVKKKVESLKNYGRFS